MCREGFRVQAFGCEASEGLLGSVGKRYIGDVQGFCRDVQGFVSFIGVR